MRQDDDFQSSSGTTTATLVEDKVESKQHQSRESVFKELNLFSSTVLAQAEKEVQEQEKPKSSLASGNEALEALKQKIEQERIQNALKLEEERKKLEEKEQEQANETEQSEQQVDEQVESLYNSSLSLESQGEEEIKNSISSVTNEKSKGYKFRFRLLTGVFCCLIAILSGWIIGNAIEISSTSSQIATQVTQGEEYNVNIAKYLQKIASLDSKTKDTPPNPEDGNLLPLEEVITITPQPLDEPTEYEKESNWFDKICNWLRNLFGG